MVSESRVRLAKKRAEDAGILPTDDGLILAMDECRINEQIFQFALSRGVLYNPSLDDLEAYMPLTMAAVRRCIEDQEESPYYGVKFVEVNEFGDTKLVHLVSEQVKVMAERGLTHGSLR